MGGPRALACLKDHNTSQERVSKTSPAKKSKNSKHKNQEKEHVPISHFKKRERSRSSSKHSSSSKRHPRSRSRESKNEDRGTENAPRASRTEEHGTGNDSRGTANAPRKTSGKVDAEQRREEERNHSVHDEQVHEESGPKTRKKSKSRSPVYSAVSSGEENPPQWARFWIDSHQNAEERLFSLENEVRKKNETYSRPSGKLESFKFEKKVYSELYEFNQKVAEQLKASLYTDDPYSRETQLNGGIALINKRNKKLMLTDRYGLGTAVAYQINPLASDSEDERHIKRAVKEAKGNFSESEMNSSSTWRELSATFNVLRSFINLIEGKVIKHRTDCQNVVRVLNSGSRKFDLQDLVCDIFNLCIKHNIQLHSDGIPRNENWNADFISKNVDRDDHMLNPEIFAAAGLRWGPHSIDRFSSFKTRQVPHFCSRW